MSPTLIVRDARVLDPLAVRATSTPA